MTIICMSDDRLKKFGIDRNIMKFKVTSYFADAIECAVNYCLQYSKWNDMSDIENLKSPDKHQ